MHIAFNQPSLAACGRRSRRAAPCCPPIARPLCPPLAAGKKGDKGGGKKGGPKKSALADLMKKKEAGASGAGGVSGSSKLPAECETPEGRMLAFQMCDSYFRLTKKFLMEGVEFDRLPAALFRAPFALLAHNKFQEGVTDPVFTYGNRAALELFEVTWEEMLEMPSRKSAVEDPSAQKDRNGLLEKAGTTGVVSGFEAWRVSAKGRKFKIRDVTLFNIMGRDGTKVGQAAVFKSYEYEDGSIHTITARAEVEEAVGSENGPPIPTPEEVEAAEAAVAEQAALIRALKGEQGMSNNDIPVQIAVVELKKRKEHVVVLTRRLADWLAASKAAFDDEDDE